MKIMNRFRAAQWLLALGVLTALPVAQAQPYPHKPVRLVVGFPPGGASDVIARVVSGKLTQQLGQPVVVENRPGANGTVAAALVAKAEPDGYTLAVTGPGSISLGPIMYQGRLAYDPARDFTPVGMVGTFPLVLLVNPSTPVRDLKAFAEYAKANTGNFQFASFGNGSPSHLASEMVQQILGVKATHVPFPGSAPAITNLIGGHVSALFDTLSSAVSQVKSGRVVGLGVTSAARMPQLPDVPTFVESGYPGFEAGGWVAIHAPTGTAPEIVARLNRELNRALALPDVVERLGALGAQVVSGPPEVLADFAQRETRKMQDLVTSTGIVLQ